MSILIIATAFSSGRIGCFDVPFAAEQPQFLAREGQEQNPALLFRLLREPARQFDHPGGARRVIVRARMDLCRSATAPANARLPGQGDRNARRSPRIPWSIPASRRRRCGPSSISRRISMSDGDLSLRARMNAACPSLVDRLISCRPGLCPSVFNHASAAASFTWTKKIPASVGPGAI